MEVPTRKCVMPKHVAIELRHRADVAHSQNNVIYFAQVEHRN